MEAASRRTAEHICFRASHISHAATVLILGLSFYSEDPDGVGDAINVFLFPDLSLLASSEAVQLARRWDAILGSGALTPFSETSLLLVKHKVDPVRIWEDADKKLEVWGVFCHIFLGDVAVHPATYKVCTLVKDTAHVSARLRAQTQSQPASPVALLCLLHTKFNERF